MMAGQLKDHPLSRRYGDIVPHVGRQPVSVTEIYLRWAGLPQDKASLTHARRNERKWLAISLEIMAREGVLLRVERDEPGKSKFAYLDPYAPSAA